MTPDTPRPDLDEAERKLREDHRPVCRWGHSPGAPDLGDCAGDCKYACLDCFEDWPCSTNVLLAEYDRRGAALVELDVALAERDAEIARLRAAAASVPEVAVAIVRYAFKDYDERTNPQFTLLSNVESFLRDEASWDANDEEAAGALAVAPAPTREQPDPADEDGSGDAEVWIPPLTDCMDHAHAPACPHCGSTVFHVRTGRCGDCGRRPGGGQR